MSRLVFCQNGFPKAVVIEGDTVIAITKGQLKKINITRVNLSECRVLLDSTEAIVSNYKLLVVNKEKQIDELDKMTATLSAAWANSKDRVVYLDDLLATRDKTIKKQKFWLKVSIVANVILLAAVTIAVN